MIPIDVEGLNDTIDPRQRDRTIPKGLERICLKCLSKRMADRYATAAGLADDLRFWLRTGEEESLISDI